jgi:hypothetical protein
MTTSSDPLVNLEKSIVTNGGKSLEKFLLYVAGILMTTNVFGTTHVGLEIQAVVTASIGLVLTGLHISTPTPKSGPGQL